MVLNATAVTKLQEMKLSASAFQEQLKSSSFQDLSFEECFGLLVDQEWFARITAAPRHWWTISGFGYLCIAIHVSVMGTNM